MPEPEINAYLTHLAVKENVSGSTQNQALFALLFRYRHVVGREVGDLNKVIRARKSTRLPVVMTSEEVKSGSRRCMRETWPIGGVEYQLRWPSTANIPMLRRNGAGNGFFLWITGGKTKKLVKRGGSRFMRRSSRRRWRWLTDEPH